MSSSSLYEPDEDEEASDSDFQHEYSKSRTPVSRSSSRIQHSRLSSLPPPERDYGDARIPGEGRFEVIEYLNGKLSSNSIEAYTETLDEIISDGTPGAASLGEASYRSTQNGVVTWTAREREILFSVLDRKGKNGIREIADAIGSKSELEVLDYLKLLHRGMERQHLLNRHSGAIVLGDMPAAAEISKECCEALNEYAALLRLQEQVSIDVSGRKKHKDFWLINAQKAREIEEQVQKHDDPGELHYSSTFLSASLFKLPAWIHLSERFFMNAGGSRFEDNWVNVAFEDESPSITADAFADFYALTISITRRLIQSSLFMAMSRIHNMRESGHSRAQVIKRCDVKTALDVLNMKHDHADFWSGLPRRYSLDIIDVRHRKGFKSRRLSISEAEDILSSSKTRHRRQRSVSRLPFESGSEDAADDDGDDDYNDNDNDHNEEYIGDDGDSESEYATSSIATDDPASDLEKQSDLEVEHADSVDQRTSFVEEQRLWDLMERPGPHSFQPVVKDEDDDDESKTLRRPISERKTKQDLLDWRDIMLYRSEWETYGHEILKVNEEIAENRRKRRRLDSQSNASLSAGVGASSGSHGNESDAGAETEANESRHLSAPGGHSERDNGEDANSFDNENDNDGMNLDESEPGPQPEPELLDHDSQNLKSEEAVQYYQTDDEMKKEEEYSGSGEEYLP